MSHLSIELGRLSISVSGVSSQIAEDAVNGLEQELTRVLGAAKFGTTSDLSLGSIDLGPVDVSSRIGARELRILLAERLGVALVGAAKGGE